MQDLPLLPGYSFRTCSAQDYKLPHKLNYSNGCRVICDSNLGIGRRPVDSASTAYAQNLPDEVVYDPSLTYGRAKTYPYRQVIPHYVLYAQKCLNFKAFFRQSVVDSPAEHHRVRHVNIIYFLEDDTMCVIEPKVDNAGFQQGRLVRRGKIPKLHQGQVYHWKDLNVGIDLAIYGIVYHTVSCDAFTSEFLRSQGIDVGEEESPPTDNYTQDRLAKLAASKSTLSASKRTRPSSDDARRRFLELSGMVLTFDATWNNDSYQILYFLTDDTMAVKEITTPNSGKDPCKLLLKKIKVPKDWSHLPSTFPSIYLEPGDQEVTNYYNPLDLKVGEKITIFGREFLLRDCDTFTRKYYSKVLNVEQPSRTNLNLETLDEDRVSGKNRPRSGLEFPSDRPSKEDVIRKIFYGSTKLRYLISMIAIHPEDEGRDFVLEYSLGDGKIKISELGKKNSGRRAGCFLASMLVPKSRGLQTQEIEYYTPMDFFVGAQINVFNHRFIVKGMDRFVLRFVEENPDKFPPHFVQNIRSYFEDTAVEHPEVEKKIPDKLEPILPAVAQENGSKDAQEVINDVQLDQESADEAQKPSSRQVSWADEVQEPCFIRQTA